MHRHVKSTVNQREIGSDTKTFALALRAALRQAPKVILIGEMRDVETIEIAMEAAETGHLVLSTLHTIDAAKTIDRIIGVFPKDQEPQVRTRFSQSFRYVISQRLAAEDRRRPHRRAGDPQVDDAHARLHPEGGDRRSVADRRHARRQRSTACRRSTTRWRSSGRSGVISKETALAYATNPTNLALRLTEGGAPDETRPAPRKTSRCCRCWSD